MDMESAPWAKYEDPKTWGMVLDLRIQRVTLYTLEQHFSLCTGSVNYNGDLVKVQILMQKVQGEA